jgi:hypothetical protein
MVTFAALEDADQGYHEYQYEPVPVENRFRDREDETADD